MGGAPSLPADMARVEHLDALRISCNHHAVSKYRADLIAFVDPRLGGVRMDEYLQPFGVPTVGPFLWATHFEPLRGFPPINTGIYAAWLAARNGVPVILAGIEFYQSPGAAYFDDCGYGVRDSNRTTQYFDRCVSKLKQIKGGQLYALSGPLLGVLPEWQ
jgi:hypothetical protein